VSAREQAEKLPRADHLEQWLQSSDLSPAGKHRSVLWGPKSSLLCHEEQHKNDQQIYLVITCDPLWRSRYGDWLRGARPSPQRADRPWGRQTLPSRAYRNSESNRCPPTSAEVMKTWIHTSTAPTNKTNKQTPWPLVRERTIPAERPPLVDEI
jgi:hypothetical protein